MYIHYAAPPYSARISSIYPLPFGKVWLRSVCWPPCATPGIEAERRFYGGRVKTPVAFILAVCGTNIVQTSRIFFAQFLTEGLDCRRYHTFSKRHRTGNPTMRIGCCATSKWGVKCCLTLSPPIPLRLYTLPYWSNPPFLIFDIRALWRSGLSARAPECQKLKTVG